MAKEKCPVCKDPIDAHDAKKALECFNATGIAPVEIKMDGVIGAGYTYAGVKGMGQKHADKNIIDLNIKGKITTTIEPELLILQTILRGAVKEKKKDGNKETVGSDSGVREDPGKSTPSGSGE